MYRYSRQSISNAARLHRWDGLLWLCWRFRLCVRRSLCCACCGHWCVTCCGLGLAWDWSSYPLNTLWLGLAPFLNVSCFISNHTSHQCKCFKPHCLCLLLCDSPYCVECLLYVCECCHVLCPTHGSAKSPTQKRKYFTTRNCAADFIGRTTLFKVQPSSVAGFAC